MENLNLAISERTRTNQLCCLTAILGTLLAIWARDPFIEIGIPFASVEVRNPTAGHAVLLGYPLLAILIFLTAGQIIRMNRIVSALFTRFARIAEMEHAPPLITVPNLNMVVLGVIQIDHDKVYLGSKPRKVILH